MKKLFTCLFIIFVGILFANPIIPGINITEFRFTANGWQMELFSGYMIEPSNLDSCQIVCSAGNSFFQTGIEYIEGTYLVVTDDDIVTPLPINANGDFVNLLYYQEIGSSFDFGTLNDMVLAPNNDQSLRSVGLSINAVDTYYVFAKDNTPSMGEQDDGEGYKGIFHGYVYDSLMNPVENVVIDHTPDCISIPDIITDNNGYFEIELYAFNYNCHIHLGSLASMDSIISIEPDSLNYYEFVFENYVSSDDHEISLPSSYYNLSNYPNPFNPNTEISFSVPQTSQFVTIEIFNSRGQIIKTIKIPNSSSQNPNQITWDGTNETGKQVPSGVYLYKLVAGGKELAANKMLLLK